MLSIHGSHEVSQVMQALSGAQVSQVLNTHVLCWLGLAVKPMNMRNHQKMTIRSFKYADPSYDHHMIIMDTITCVQAGIELLHAALPICTWKVHK